MNSLAIAGSLAAILATGWGPNGWNESVSADLGMKEAVAQPRLMQAALILDQAGLASARRTKVKTIGIRSLVAASLLAEFSSVSGGLNPAECSLGTTHTCSTSQGGTERDCSVKEDDQQGSSASCSVLGAINSGFCSVDSGTNDFCSVRADDANPNSDCSVKSTGHGNFCSVHEGAKDTTGSNNTMCSVEGKSATKRDGAQCSVFNGTGPEQYCSVYKNSDNDHVCTVFQGHESVNEPKCSTHDAGAGTLCSVVDPGGTPPVTGPQAGLCTANKK